MLGLLALFTHNNIFWVAALLLAFVQVPDFVSPLGSIANSLSRMANRPDVRSGIGPEPLREASEPDSPAEERDAAAPAGETATDTRQSAPRQEA
ncbi:hypothetical protein QW131_04475 [Roseibium salinum]|nr:hypothetical protein [Roseibium salinum]